MPILQYFAGVGGALLCLMLALNYYVPKAPPREQHELDKSTIRITSKPSGDFVIDHFPQLRDDLAADPADAVRRALAMMPDGDKQAEAQKRAEQQPSAGPRKRRVAQHPQTRMATREAPLPGRPQDWSDNGWSPGWSNPPSNWNSNWPQSWSNNRWANNQWQW